MPDTFVTLKEGSKGAEVTKLQQRLKTLKYYAGAIDGNFGPQTKASVINFQKKNAVKDDGIVGYETEAAIQRALWVSQRQTIQEGSKGNDVEKLQTLLQQADEINKDHGVVWNVPGGFGIRTDGIFGANTKAAVIKFQQAEKLKADGVVGALTWKALSGIITFDLEPIVIVNNDVFDLA
ncbi:peptidoglycan-binding domain-containing protein [Iningainema tapete]|uniref:Peptidoglycan-binding protein n=1 Tax=Iningainema tapete BLCC-T55 TaxID=2748662 RepID=A0A8J7C740_9CYAN|nr:peptidoglycan-binding protein [Iningainema tapete]MBD2775169.1 peptidoglycan-binding protein [Iningainema tapete BLCC-T55]